MLNKYQSIIQPRGAVPFPAFTGERVYMVPTRKGEALPAHLSRWQPTVDAMLDGIDTDGPVYVMIDQSVVMPAHCQRRPGLHVDGYWQPGLNSHGGGHGAGRGNSWANATLEDPEAILLASNVTASRALEGVYTGQFGEGGDCSHMDVDHLTEVLLEANRVYAGNVAMLHESLPVPETTPRTLVRINVPGWSP